MRHLERLIAGVAALVIVAIADDYDGAAELVPRLVLRELVAAGEVDGVIKRGSTAGTQVANGGSQLVGVADEVGYQLGRSVEAHHHGLVEVGAHHAVDELAGGLLLELEAFPDAVAGVDQNAQAEGQVGLRREVGDGLPPLAFDDFKIVLDEVGDEAALLVGDGEQQADARDVDLDAGGLVALKDLARGAGGVLAGDGRNGDGDHARGREWRPNSHMVRL